MFKLSRSIALMASVIPVLRSLSLLNTGAPVFTIEAETPAPKRRSNKPKRSKPGRFSYPHSSARQRARYARQIAAGQLRMAGIEEAGHG